MAAEKYVASAETATLNGIGAIVGGSTPGSGAIDLGYCSSHGQYPDSAAHPCGRHDAQEPHAHQSRHVASSTPCRRTSRSSSSTGSPDVRTTEAFRYPDGEALESVTWKQAGDEVERLAAGLIALGIEPEQRVGIASGTRYEWILADLAIMCAGARDHHRLPEHQRRGHGVHPRRLREPRRLRRGRRADRQAHRRTRPSCRTSRKVVTFDGTADGDWVIGLEDLAALGDDYLAEQPDAVVERRRRRSRPTSWPP